MDETEKREAAAFLLAFITDMQAYQQLAGKGREPEVFGSIKAYKEFVDQMSAELKKIYDKYIQYKTPPETETFSMSYDPKTEEIIDISKKGNKIIIITDRTTSIPRRKCMYTLEKTKEGYKILDNVKSMNEYMDKFEKYHFQL